MPRRNRHDPAFNNLPASGLREDVFDEALKENSLAIRRHSQVETFIASRNSEDEYWQKVHEGYIDPFEGEGVTEPAGWRPSHRVTSSETAAWVVASLLRREKIRSNVEARLAGYELTRRENPFDAPAFLKRLGFLPKAQHKDDWRGNYSMRGVRYKVVLDYDKVDPCITVQLVGGKRLVVFFSGGLPDSTGTAEPGIIRDLAGRVTLCRHADHRDVFAIAVPRSGAFHRTITGVRDAFGVSQLGIHWVTVERKTGEVNGLDAVAGPVKTRRAI